MRLPTELPVQEVKVVQGEEDNNVQVSSREEGSNKGDVVDLGVLQPKSQQLMNWMQIWSHTGAKWNKQADWQISLPSFSVELHFSLDNSEKFGCFGSADLDTSPLSEGGKVL
jgi:hypothetical protein